MEAISIKDLVEETQRDPTLTKLNKCLIKGKISDDPLLKPYNNLDQITSLDSGIMMKREKIILPSSLVRKAIMKAHQGSHTGITAMKRRIRSHFYHPNLDEMIEKYVQKC